VDVHRPEVSEPAAPGQRKRLARQGRDSPAETAEIICGGNDRRRAAKVVALREWPQATIAAAPLTAGYAASRGIGPT